jgi:hypothetical protein
MARSVLSPDDWREVATWVNEEKARRKRRRMELERTWKEVDRQVAMKPISRVYGRGNAKDWYPELELPSQFNTLEVVAADVRRLLFPRDTDWYDVNSDVSDEYRKRWDQRRLKVPLIGKQAGPMQLDQETADALVKATVNHYHRYYDFIGQMNMLIIEALKYGTLCGRVRSVKWTKFSHDYRGVESENIEGPAIIPCSMNNTYLDDTTAQVMQEGVMTGPLTMQRYWQNLEDLKRAAKSGGKDRGWMKARVAELEPMMGPDEKEGQVELIRCEGDFIVPKSQDSIFLPNCWLTVAVGNNGPTVVRFETNPQNFRSFFVGHYMRTDLNSPYGVSPLMKGQPVAEAMTEIFCDLTATSRIRARPPVAWDKNDPGMQGTSGPEIAPNAMWATDNPKEGVVPIEIGDLAAATNAYLATKKAYEELTGVTDPRRSAEVKSHTTATAADNQANIGLSRTEDFVSDLESGAITSIMYMEWKIAKDTLTKAQPISINQDGIEGWIKVASADLPDDVRFTVTGSSGMMDIQKRNQAAQQAHVVAVQGVGAAKQLGLPVPELDIEAMIKDGYVRAGIDNADKFVKPPKPQPDQQQPNPDVMKVQQDGQLQQAQMQADQQLEGQKLQLKQAEMAQSAQLEQLKINAQQQLQLEIEKIKSATALEVARITKGADIQSNIHQIVADTINAAEDRRAQAATQIIMGSNGEAVDMQKHSQAMSDTANQMAQHMSQLADLHKQAMTAHQQSIESNQKVMEAMNKPKKRSVSMTMPNGRMATANITEQ